MAGSVYVGTSGFDYPEWKGSFYPSTLKRREMLPFYAERFRSVEINYTFRREPTADVLRAWRAATREGFLFALKAHQRITHWQRLSAADHAVDRFLALARTLEDRLGPILFQLPPNLTADRDLLRRFLDRLPDDLRVAFEFRHPSWRAAAPLLAERGVAWCLAETDAQPFRDTALPPGPYVYLRLRRTTYGRADLTAWAERIREASSAGRDVFCYFKHEEAGAGAEFAGALISELSGRTGVRSAQDSDRSMG
jgi:uncharacterized protein YecE (DUF72 family)